MKTSTDSVLQRFTLHGATMGTRYSAVFHADAALDTAPIAQALFAAVDRVDRQMSTWKPDSDLSRLNAAEIGAWVEIPAELGKVLAEGLRIGQISSGAFDIGAGDLVAASGFGAKAGSPDPATCAARRTGARISAATALELSPNRRLARRTSPVSLDLSGIAKGFGVDELGRVLDGYGLASWLCSIDGEARARGTKPDGSAWAIALERPEAGIRAPMGVLELADCAVATSGTYRHLRQDHDGMISHTMDPRTGAALRNGLASVTVLARTCMEADALATAFLVMGEESGPKMAQVLGIDAVFVTHEGRVMTNLS